MDIGQRSPPFRLLRLHFSHSKPLHELALEYQIFLVKALLELIRSIRTSRWQSLGSDFYEAFKAKVRSLDQVSTQIHYEIALQTATSLTSNMREDNSLSNIRKSRMAINRSKLLDFCSRYDYQTTWKRLRKVATTSGFQKDLTYQHWRDYTLPCTLTYSGRMGTGKSVTLANIVEDLQILRSDQCTIAFFFCSSYILESLSTSTILGCLARQL